MFNNMSNQIEEDIKIIRILGVGQFKININTVKEINQKDNEIVRLLQDTDNDDSVKKEFSEKIKQICNIIKERGSVIESEEIVTSDIIIPGIDIDLKEAKELFKGEGVINELY